MKRLVTVVIFIILCITSKVFAEKPTALFLMETQPITRLYSMGSIFSSVNAVDAFYNPWALGWTVNKGISLSQWPGFIEGSKYNFGGIILPTNKGIFNYNFAYLNYSTGKEAIEEFDGTTRTITLENNTLFSLGWGLPLGEYVFAGGNLKYLTSTLAEEYTGKAMLFDLGVAFSSLSDKHTFGVAFKNIGNTLQYSETPESLPTEAQIGYSYNFKPWQNHKLILGSSLSKMTKGDTSTIAAGIEYFPGVPFFSIQGGVKKRDGNIIYTAGAGINLFRLDLNIGYSLASSKYSTSESLARFSINYLFGPMNQYSTAEAYLNEKHMRKKAIALWEDIGPKEKYYAEAQKALELYMYPPQLIASCYLKDDSGDGILAAGEKGKIVIKIDNKGQGKAQNVRVDIKPIDFGKVTKYVDIGSYMESIDIVPPGKSVELEIPVAANMDATNEKINFNLNFTEQHGFNPKPLVYSLPTKEFPPPILMLAKYTFREDNTGNTIGNGNGKIEPGEQIEFTGYIINAGESSAKNVSCEIVSDLTKINIITPGSNKIDIGDLEPKGYKKIVFAVKIDKDYAGKELPIKVILNEARQRYSKLNSLNVSIGKFYQDPIETVMDGVDTTAILSTLPILAGPIPGAKAKEIIRSKSGATPKLEFEANLVTKDNNKICTPGDQITLKIIIRNTGEGLAEGVAIELTGDPTLVSLLEQWHKIGDIEPGRTQPITITKEIPENISRKPANIRINLKEAKGFDVVKFQEFNLALMPRDVKSDEALPLLEPWPIANKDKRPNAAAVVIGIGSYQKENKIKYAKDDAVRMVDYINGVIGIPKRNIKLYIDSEATKTTIEVATKDWLAKNNYDFVVFYFAGHGEPNVIDNVPYLVPFDVNPDLGKGTLVSLNEIISSLEASKAKEILVVLDACFSGTKSDRTPVKLQRGLAVVPKIDTNRAIIFSASSETQPANDFDKAGHGYFSYYLMLGLKGEADTNHDGQIDLEELYTYVDTKLREQLDGKQTPNLKNIPKSIPMIGKYR